MSESILTVADELQSGKAIATFTQGRSMEPLLHTGKTHVVVEPLENRLSPGDLPLYKRKDGVYVIHRVVEVGEDYYLTRGDNCFTTEKVFEGQMLGVVTEIYRNGKNVRVTDPSYRRYVNLLQATEFIRLPLYRLRARASRTKQRLRLSKRQASAS